MAWLSGMRFIIAILILAGFVWITRRFWDRHDLDDGEFSRRRFGVWIGKGLVMPVLVWMFVNAGISRRYPPLLAHIEVAKASGGHWVSAWLALVLPAVFVVSSYWAATTLAWLVAVHAFEMESS